MMMNRFSAMAGSLMLALTIPLAAHAQPLADGDNSEHVAKHASDTAPTAAAQENRKAQHARIQQERAALAASRQKDEAACYKRFAVEDCLREVRAKVREVENRLRAQELALNEAERRDKAADRMRAIEEKQKTQSSGIPARKNGNAKVRKPPVEPRDVKTQHGHDATQRAQQQRERAASHATEQATRASSNAQRAAQTRERHAETLKAADERRARVEKANADAVAQGKKPAAPLPAPDLQR